MKKTFLLFALFTFTLSSLSSCIINDDTVEPNDEIEVIIDNGDDADDNNDSGGDGVSADDLGIEI